jgi:threonine/homoserine/homoserine lactone efflux protein
MYWVLKIAGGSYLVYLGVRIWLGAREPIFDQAAEPLSSARAWRSFASGLATQMSNPKAAIVYSSVFAAFLPASPSMAFNLSVAAMVFGIEAGWYVFVALALSASGPRGIYLRYKSWIDRVAGGVMVALGLRLVSATGRP